ncbi:MAG: PTS system mannose/fructose/sorbose family transporter subunit IID [bacterium]
MAALSTYDLLKIVHRSLYIQGTWNYERMLGLGYCFCLIPFARKKLKDSAEISCFLKRHLGFFNTHPYMAGWIIGAVMSLEEQGVARQTVYLQQSERFKKKMSELLAAIGDQLFWSLIKPLAALLGFGVALYFQIAGVVVFLTVYNLPHFYMRTKGVLSGYRKGLDTAKELSFKRFHQINDRLLQIGAFLVGLVFVLTVSTQIDHRAEMAAFVLSSGGAFSCFRKKALVPAMLVVLILVSAVVGGFFT